MSALVEEVKRERHVLQKAFGSLGCPLRSLQHVQEALLSIPMFFPPWMLLKAAVRGKLCTGPSGGCGLDEETEVDLELQCFITGQPLTFPQFISLIRVVGSIYHESAVSRAAPDFLLQAIDGAVEVGNWESLEGVVPANGRQSLASDDTLAASIMPSVTINNSVSVSSPVKKLHDANHASAERVRSYLGWFGLESEVLGQASRGNHAAALGELLSSAAETEGPQLLVREDSVDPTTSATIAPKSREASTAPKTKSAAPHVGGGTLRQAPPGAAGGHRAAEGKWGHPRQGGEAASGVPEHPHQATTSLITQHWLHPEFGLRGHGPRASFFTHDTAPSRSDWDAHQRMKLASKSSRHTAKMKRPGSSSPHASSLQAADNRSVAEKLRLPRLSPTVNSSLENMVASAVADYDSRWYERVSQWTIDGVRSKTPQQESTVQRLPPGNFEINRMIDVVYRKAQGLGVSTAKSNATVDRRIAAARRQQHEASVNVRRQQREAGFQL